jgi:hypothetical protein
MSNRQLPVDCQELPHLCTGWLLSTLVLRDRLWKYEKHIQSKAHKFAKTPNLKVR